MEVLNDEYYMSLAIQLAGKASGQTGINPVVGCVVVKEGRIVGIGTHLKRGEGHAEVHALSMAGSEAQGATVYVTLEPCSHHGKTPPCCDLIMKSGAARVVVAATDPNPVVSGKGVKRLREQGIEVSTGLMEHESRALNEKFNKYITTRLPFVTWKTASTLDGKIATEQGDSKWVTGAVAREQTHMLRHQHAAIMVGIGTALADDPQLTTRAVVPAIHPIRIIVDSSLRLPLDARVVSDKSAPTIVLTTEQADAEKRRLLKEAGVDVISCGVGTVVDMKAALAELGRREIGSILLEGGGKLSGSMLDEGLIDKVVLYYATKFIGGAQAPQNIALAGRALMSEAIPLERVQVEMAGDDICVTGYPRYAADTIA
ncbi:bifunctional diaminohydroxyphosphoribosylaminopyrimidine deaminase/5-amino-6-(5-phosphoribosylamino)uracil reductase RibD [Paenibacillus sp. 1011MAR3C5]|uniref:bifunctional diaminohydroxyphosphoribosylaminopyrimidine deaminase/5-amino-6-(5-phosphoribosylamino)uracil reductase RibD n=1 Tax=Paenibacillus sp. 1011MAR3C5 TaxID=1675787 RepID=UPI002175D34D|nr:bifunctional diaminohydroxyphosphoribosylaminopyrimidine deaminase/5-amino-6-(5-phosphoribosylamino)uracil reductase RibD [Paenibacillus sp. 1011MAR3C5]